MHKIITVLLISSFFQPVIIIPEDEPEEISQTVIAAVQEEDELITPGVIIEGYPAEGIAIPFSQTSEYDSTQPHLTKSGGVFYGPSGKEKYYNLSMSGVVKIMRDLGYSEADYPFWVRSDGAKMLGNYVMVAANLSEHPRGSIVKTSLGMGLVCDKCEGAYYGDTNLDLAVNW